MFPQLRDAVIAGTENETQDQIFFPSFTVSLFPSLCSRQSLYAWCSEASVPSEAHIKRSAHVHKNI
jgi:hypothetical protein